ncbi:hypothetical protein C4Y11_11640, partial [Escherichia coli]
SSGAGRTSDGNGSHASTLKSPSYTKSVSWQHYLSFASPERLILIGVILWKVKTSSILMLFLLIIHHLIPQCS